MGGSPGEVCQHPWVWGEHTGLVRVVHRSCGARETSEALMVLLSGHERGRPRDQAFRPLH